MQLFTSHTRFIVLGLVVLVLLFISAYHHWQSLKSEQYLHRRLNEELHHLHERINNSLDYSRAIVEYFEPRHQDLLVDESNRLFLPTLPVKPEKESPTDIFQEKPLSNRERNTLLTIIAALCKEAKLDYTKHAKTAGLIQSTVAGMGASIGETTIEGHLKKIPEALGTRMK